MKEKEIRRLIQNWDIFLRANRYAIPKVKDDDFERFIKHQVKSTEK